MFLFSSSSYFSSSFNRASIMQPFLKLALPLLPQLQAYRHMNPGPAFYILPSSFLLVSFLFLLLYLFICVINKFSQGLECTRQALKQVLKTIEERKHRRQIRRGKKGEKKKRGWGRGQKGRGGMHILANQVFHIQNSNAFLNVEAES